MVSTNCRPVADTRDPFLEELQLRPAGDQNLSRLPRVERTRRSGPVLQPSPIHEENDILSLNIARGCGHRCAFCSVRASPSYPGDEAVYLYDQTPQQLKVELRSRRVLPRAVYVSPSTDPFPPVLAVQSETVKVVQTLADHGVEAWLMTRGYIRPKILKTLSARRDLVKVTIPLTTTDRGLQRILEPLAASTRLRLRQIAALRELGIRVQASLEPLVPGLTDTRESLSALLAALADVGVQQLSAGYMFLRSGILENIIRALEPHGLAELVLHEFAGGPVFSSGVLAGARYLPKSRRQRGYATLMALAAGHGITVRVSGITNPDFTTARPSEPNAGSRHSLFEQVTTIHGKLRPDCN
jgi:DNA repair photolyase